MRTFARKTLLTSLAPLLSLLLLQPAPALADVSLLNVSYDPTRELYQDYNLAFATYWRNKTRQILTVSASHGGSGKQARTVLDGSRQADVVTLGLAADIDLLVDGKGPAAKPLIRPDWKQRLPYNAAPYTSTIVLLVRKGNPKGIHDWNDLARPGVEVVTPDPRTSAGARWNYLAAWGYALRQPGGNEATARDFVSRVFRNVKKMESGARGATAAFVVLGQGDVLMAWENEAYLAVKEWGPDKYEVVTPSVSILTEPPVAVVDAVVDKRGTRKEAEEYLKYLYSPEGQEIIGKHYYRPADPRVAQRYTRQFAPLRLFTIDEVFGGWGRAQKTHFAKGGVFEQILARNLG
jgi:sulfate transport system substrate-binding protein